VRAGGGVEKREGEKEGGRGGWEVKGMEVGVGRSGNIG